ncbi:MAG: nitroreductase family protein [Spirochaetaceae bacterium]|jgi:nitroreductase|nr:nitroreductase family protein [Spirochaetaceae bacterium]
MAENETLNVIRRRRSIREYGEKQIPDDTAALVLEAGLYAPSAGGNIENDIHFTVIQKRETLDRINLLAKEAARASGLSWLVDLGNDDSFHCLYRAPTLILVSYRAETAAPETDAAAATENMLLAAESLGLGACWLYFPLQAFSSAAGRDLLKTFGLPEGFRPYSSLIAGYRAGAVPVIPPRKTEHISWVR